jgi:hypothetical protein
MKKKKPQITLITLISLFFLCVLCGWINFMAVSHDTAPSPENE